MTWVSPFQALSRPAEDLMSGQESGAEVVYAEFREAEEAADRRHDFSDHLLGFEVFVDPLTNESWRWHMGPDR